ncbi:MAG TPA: hypothetical protein VG276_04615 [Actinomycetes bacterium]|nr:hypothetical protein [Actinomycetes bacterium]
MRRKPAAVFTFMYRPMFNGTVALQVAAGGFMSELAAGWAEVRGRTWLWATIADFALYQVGALGALFVLGPLVADRTLGGPSAWGVLLAALGIGSILGDLVALRAAPQRLLVAMTWPCSPRRRRCCCLGSPRPSGRSPGRKSCMAPAWRSR